MALFATSFYRSTNPQVGESSKFDVGKHSGFDIRRLTITQTFCVSSLCLKAQNKSQIFLNYKKKFNYRFNNNQQYMILV